ncbi:Protein of unknown function [Rhizobium sp. RU36D]|nr:Protein of unknown function [Rhizobium sp. RU36D]
MRRGTVKMSVVHPVSSVSHGKLAVSLVQQIPVSLVCAAFLTFLAKHYIADFLLQSHWMAHGKEQATGWLWPLVVHAGVHGVLTTAIFAVFAPSYAWLGLVDFAVHFAIDRAKAQASRAVNATPSRPVFWWLLGLDQSLHHLTHFGFILVIAGLPLD